jgi:DNA-binding PadR family transcriptional regulator
MFEQFDTPQPAMGWAGGYGPRRGPWGGPWGGPGFRGGPFFWHMARRFGFGPGFGPGFGFGPGPGGPRMFGRGDLKYALLDLLQERPKHGYEMIKELESRAGGFYTPSAGAVYPTLQLLEDRGWVSVETTEGKKVYAITDAGRQEFKERREREAQRPEGGPRGPWGWGGPDQEPGRERGHERGHHHGRGPWGGWRASPELRDLANEGRDVARLTRMAVMSAMNDPERLAQLRALVQRTRADLLVFLNQSQEGQPAPGAEGSQHGPETPTSGPIEQI